MKPIAALVTHPVSVLAMRVTVGGLFVAASLYKINYPGEFAESLAAYQLAPHGAVNGLAVAIPWTELVAGVLLVLGVRTKAAAAVIGALLVLFSLAIATALLRGIPIGCGCFTSVEDPVSWSLLGRDLLWLAMTIIVYRRPSALQLEERLFRALREVEA